VIAAVGAATGVKNMTRFALALICGISWVGAATAQASAIPDALIEKALKDADCNVEFADAKKNMTAHKIDAKYSLVEVSCFNAAYNFSSILFVVTGGKPDKARLLRFQNWDGKRFEWTHALTFATWHEKTRRLTMFHKSRGPADCGSAGEWQWAGTDFRMVGFWYKDPCDGKLFGFGTPNFNRWRIFPKRK
jgi:hypothetical protein